MSPSRVSIGLSIMPLVCACPARLVLTVYEIFHYTDLFSFSYIVL